MLNPRQQKYADRLKELVEEGKQVAALETGYPSYDAYIKDGAALHAWLSKVRNIVETVFGTGSPQHKHFELLTHDKHMQKAYELNPVVGLLKGSLNDLENGFLTKQEFINCC